MQQDNMIIFKLELNYFRFLKESSFKFFLGFRICEIYQKLHRLQFLYYLAEFYRNQMFSLLANISFEPLKPVLHNRKNSFYRIA